MCCFACAALYCGFFRRESSLGPLLDLWCRQVAQFEAGARFEGDRSQQRLPDHHRRHHPGACFLRSLDEILERLVVDRLRRAVELLDVAIDVVERLLAHLDGVQQADVVGHVSTEADADFFAVFAIASCAGTESPS